MQPHGHRLRDIRLADDDRHLIAQALAATEHHELAGGSAFQRNRRTAHNAQILDLAGTIGENVLGRDAEEALQRGEGRHKRDCKHGRQHER